MAFDLGKKLGDFPLQFAISAFFGGRPSPGTPATVKNGSATLLNLESGPIAVTCAHVLSGFRELRASSGEALFQFGNVVLNPLNQIIDEDPDLDLATIGLSVEQARRIQKDGLFDCSFFTPVTWPPPPVTAGSVVALGGYPGCWRDSLSSNEIDFLAYSIGATGVTSVSETHFACQFNRDQWQWSYRAEGLGDVRDIGGLSGGPAFVARSLHFDLAGFIYEFNQPYDILFLRPAHLIDARGHIRRSQ